MDYKPVDVKTITTTTVFCIHSTDEEGKSVGECVGWSYHRSGAEIIVIQKEDGTEDVWLLLKPSPINSAQIQDCIDIAREKLIERAEKKLTAGELAAMQGTELDVGDADPEEDEEHPER
jgi:hypothetical protein